MKAVVQRVQHASVRVDGEVVGRCGPGMLVLVGVMRGDTEAQVRALADKIARFRFFADETGRMNLSAVDVGGEALVISQVTLAADGRKGRRPSLDAAADPALADRLYSEFAERLAGWGIPTQTGRFGAQMEVELINDGPITFALEERPGATGATSTSD